MTVLILDLSMHGGPTPADDMAPTSSLTMETSHWTSSSFDAVALHYSSKLWDLDFKKKSQIYFDLKREMNLSHILESVFLDHPLKPAVISLLVHVFLPHFLLLVNFALMCLQQFEQPAFSTMYL